MASYDYYPYGQLMPDRWGNDTSTICVTTSQIQMLPRKIMTSVPLTKVTFDTSRYTGYAGPVPWPRTLTIGPDGVTTDDYRRGVMVVLDVTPGVPIDVSVELGKFYAPNHMFNTWEYHPSGVGGIRNFWTTSWWWLPGVQTHTCTPLTDKIYLSVYSNWWNYTMGDLGQFPNFTIKSINYEKVVYEPQSVLVQLCNKAEDKYEFGYNTQMKVNEVAGIGNWNTAKYWEYSTRNGHRENPDPVRIPGESPYCAFNGNPILKSDVNGDFSKVGAWTRNLLQGGSGISKLENGEWGFRKSGVINENGENKSFVKMTYNDRVSRTADFLSKSVSQWGPNFYRWRDRMFQKLNNTWMNKHGSSWDDYAKNRGAYAQKAGIEWTADGTEQAGMETNTAPNHLFRDAWSMPGAKGDGNAGDALENIVGGTSDVIDYITGDKPLIRRVGPKSYFDTSKKFDYQKNLWHIRAKDGDTIENAYDGDKTPVPNF